MKTNKPEPSWEQSFNKITAGFVGSIDTPLGLGSYIGEIKSFIRELLATEKKALIKYIEDLEPDAINPIFGEEAGVYVKLLDKEHLLSRLKEMEVNYDQEDEFKGQENI